MRSASRLVHCFGMNLTALLHTAQQRNSKTVGSGTLDDRESWGEGRGRNQDGASWTKDRGRESSGQGQFGAQE